MWSRWANYRISMRNIRQKYFTFLRRSTEAQRQKTIIKYRKRFIKGILLGIGGGIAYYYANEIYSEHIEIKKMKKKFMKLYPSQTYIISFKEDPMELLREVQIHNTEEDKKVTKLTNPRCLLINEDTNEISQFRQKFGDTVIIFSPNNIDELCTAVENCNKYRHTVFVGSFPMPQTPDILHVKHALKDIEEPERKQKYIIVDLSHFNMTSIDQTNDLLTVQTGANCNEINQRLQERGFEPLFPNFCSAISLHQMLTKNLPLNHNKSIMSLLQNLSLISAEGKRFKSSTEVSVFGEIPNLTSLFLGTGGAFAIPATAYFKIQRKGPTTKTKCYKIQSNNLSDLVLKWRKIREQFSSHKIPYRVISLQTNQLLIQVQSNENVSNLLDIESIKQQQNKQTILNLNTQLNYLFSVNNSIFQTYLLNKKFKNSFYLQNDLLGIMQCSPEDLSILLSIMSVNGGVLVWSKDKQAYKNIKKRIDLSEVGAQLMKKIVQIRQGIDKKHILQSHSRYEKYFAKGFFRKVTQFFW